MLDFSQDLSAQTPLVHPTSRIQNCTLGRYVEIGDRCVLEETAVGGLHLLFRLERRDLHHAGQV